MSYLIDYKGDNIIMIEQPKGFKKWLCGNGIMSAKIIGVCRLQIMPGCGAVGILTGFKIAETYQDKGFGEQLLNIAIYRAVQLKYSKILATVNQNSPKMHHLLQKKEFIKMDDFNNIKTNNQITLYVL